MSTHHLQQTNATIMMIDDEPITTEIVKAYLEDDGYRNFVIESDSSKGIEVMLRAQPDLLLLDLVMPTVGGFEVLEKLRQHEQFAHLPVIILTSSSDPASKLKALELGATDFLAKPVDEIELRLRVRNTLAAKAYMDQLAFYDPVTKLPNISLFSQNLNWALEKSKRHSDPVALLDVAVDNFGRINGSMGHKAGDALLLNIAKRIETVIRRTDLLADASKDSGHSLYRAEGGSFLLLLERIQSAENSALVARRIMQAMAQPINVQGKEIYLTVSIGISTTNDGVYNAEIITKHASGARDFAKKNGGNQFLFASKEINTGYEKRLELENELRKAVSLNELELYYQPKVVAATGRIYGAEALLRWNSKSRGFVSPGDFIPLAEQTGLIIPIGKWVIMNACQQLAIWQKSGAPPVNVSINLSARQFEDKMLFPVIKAIVERSGVDPRFLTLELTESLLLDDLERKIEVMEQLKGLGLKLSIDDFGTGYSSLSYLRQLPVDELKIDRAFIINTPDKEDSCAIASSVIFLANKLGLITVAEGVENRKQLEFLMSEGCQRIQGFYFSKPLQASDLTRLLLNRVRLPLQLEPA